MAWKMDANYGKMVNNLLNKEKPPMDENGNYIINAGTRSEKRIPKAEFEAQQKNAPTQTDMDALTKMLSEREANRLKAAQEGSQNPEPYNPRAEWVKNNTWKMDANYGKMVNNLLNKEKPPMDENGNYIINAGTRSEKRIPKAEFEAQQKNAPTQTDMDALTKTSKANTPMPYIDTPKAIGPKSNTPTTTSTTQGGKIFTGNTIDTSKDPNNLPYNNPESNKPILPTSYSGQISLPTPPEEMQLMDFLKKQFEDKTWENKYDELQKQYQELADRPDKYSGMIEKAGGEDVAGYIKSLYEGSADPLRREAQRMQEQNAADLASRGLGMSTVVNDVNNPVQRELLANLTDLSNRANVQGRDMYLNALKSAADVYGQSNAQKGNILNAMQTNIGNQMGAQQIGLANINDILAKQEARRLTNMQTGINQWDKDVANYWKYQYYPIDAYAGQNSTAATAASVGGQVYNQANTNAAGQNQLVGDVGATLAKNLFKQPQNSSWVPVGGLSGAQQGGTTGFSTKPKTGAFNQ